MQQALGAGPSDTNFGDYNRTVCAGPSGIFHPGPGASAGGAWDLWTPSLPRQPWHKWIQQGRQTAPPLPALCPQSCLPSPSPARHPGPGQIQGLAAFSSPAGGTGGARRCWRVVQSYSLAHCHCTGHSACRPQRSLQGWLDTGHGPLSF